MVIYTKNQIETCKIFECSIRSLMRWVNKYKSTNNISDFDKLKKIYQDGFWNLIINNLDILWDWKYISGNKNITWDIF